MNNGFIKLYRCIEDSFLWNDSQAVHLWIQLLLSANHKPKDMIISGKKKTIESGQFICSRLTLSNKTGISESKVQRLLKLYENEQMIEQQMNSKFRVISILNWEKYQSSEQQVNSTRTAGEQQVNTNKNNKKEKNDKNKEKENKKKKKSFGLKNLVKMKEEEYEKLVNLYGKQKTDSKILDFESYKDMNRYKDHYLAINNWLRKDKGQNGCKADDEYLLFNPDKAQKGDDEW